MVMRLFTMLFVLCFVLASPRTRADEQQPTHEDDGEFSLMSTLSRSRLQSMEDEEWNAYGQATYISSWKSAFSAAYTNLNGTTNSLSPNAERSFTGSLTVFLGWKPWKGGELYLAPEVISERPLSDLHGLGGSIQNFELQKTGAESPTVYLSRVFFKQTWKLDGEESEVASGPMQLAGPLYSHRFVITLGNLSIIDIFDKNSFAGELRKQWLNMAFMTYAAYDFAADSRGYSWGVVGEYYRGDWAMRVGRFIAPKHPNQLSLDFGIFRYYGDQVELEHRHDLYGQPGAVRILGYRNYENMGRWDDAIAAYQADHSKNATTCTTFNYGSENSAAPDLCWARKPNAKMGVGINLEQSISTDLGIFFRGMIADGKTEVYSYTSADSSIAFGTLGRGTYWGREKDTFGIGYAQSWISKEHAAYLNLGGIDGFIGDGRLNVRPERVVDIFYSIHVMPSAWLTLDYQHIANPAFNADRGPVDIYGLRGHVEF